MHSFSAYWSKLSKSQKIWFVASAAVAVAIIISGYVSTKPDGGPRSAGYSIDQTIGEVAAGLEVTGKALARDLGLSIEVSKKKPMRSLGVSQEKLDDVTLHLASHVPSNLTYYVYAALVWFGLVYLVRLGRPDASPLSARKQWFNRAPYILALAAAVVLSGFILGKSPNPMEGIVKVFKSMVGLYPSVLDKVVGLLFFVALAVVGNKLVCGWACPFGAIQELVYSMPVLKKHKRKKMPFAITNAIRISLFVVALILLFGFVGNSKGFVVYHGINPFNLFDLDLDSFSLRHTVYISIVLSLFFYRPFCHLVCPFGLVSWIAEKFSLARVRIDPSKCTKCGACARSCPSEAALGRVQSKSLPADCFSCARCLNVCPEDAISYGCTVRKSSKQEVNTPGKV